MINNIDEVKKEIIPVLKRHDVARASIFGSFVRGEQKDESERF